ncbi:MAG: carboxypeptidase regulatory-like domain-containing protein, partial [Bryobacteraceae bacterium]
MRILAYSFALLWLAVRMAAQTATTAVISGTVRDPSGAVVPGAAVELLEVSTKLSRQQTTNEAGQYFFPSVPPGQYDLKVSATGFRSATVHQLRVEVARSYVQDVELEVGAITETVAVTAEARAELQTVDSTVGNVLSGRSLPVLPTFTRQANELLTLQPGVTPDGQVTGARNDQSSFALDGIEVTNQSVGGLTTYMYLGIESVEEFRVGVANPNASFGRGAGGQVSIIGRRGSNELHGALFWYHQNDDLNANTWTNNRNRIQEPELKDNRFGFRVGGPAWPDRIFYFLNYDGRRFPRSSDINRLVPTESLRRGELRFRDAAGNINSYPLATSRLCGPTGDQPCDPRGLGLSPAIAKLWSFLPPGNDPSLGDGLNTIGFRATVQHPFTSDFYMGRLDFNLNSNWRLDGAFRYYRELDR